MAVYISIISICFCSVDKNVDNCSSGSCTQKKKFPLLIVALTVSLILVSTVVLVLICMLKKKNTSNVKGIVQVIMWKYTKFIHVLTALSTDLPSQSIPPEANHTLDGVSETMIETKRKRFSYSEVIDMTNNFQRALGEGGFGVVYHGYLNGSEQVAVKLLSQSSVQGYKEFKAEVWIFS